MGTVLGLGAALPGCKPGSQRLNLESRAACKILARQAVAKIDCIFECLWPKIYCDCFGPAMASMKKCHSCALRDISDASLSNAILMVCAHTTKRDGLLQELSSTNKCIIGELAIFANTMLELNMLKCLFSLDDLG